ncbi:MAG: pantetheine-phosphate adenylyltransferase [Gammaproteobacteria bacterium]|nr:MAG: pantetheine-phosphate adenylyltransferase [Gammaproteobacteria bacterium]
MNITAVYPGTFDPITNGHADLVQRAACLYDQVIVAVATSSAKSGLFNVDERVSMAREILSSLANVEVCSFDNLLVDFARSRQAQVILRGLRAVSDFEYEFQLAGMNRKMCAEIETMFLMPAEKYTYISSSLVREIASLGGDVSSFVDHRVRAALTDKLG